MNSDNKKIEERFLELLENLPPDKWNIKVNKNWTVKDAVAHLVGWEKEVESVFRNCLQTKEKPWFWKTNDFDSFNKKSVDELKHLSGKELIEEWKKWQAKIEQDIKNIGEKTLRDNPDFSWIFDEEHYLQHFEQIKKALK